MSKYKKIAPKTRHLLKFGSHFEKKRPHGFIQHWDFCRQPDFNSPMAKVSKNSGLQKSPGGAGFRLLAHRLFQQFWRIRFIWTTILSPYFSKQVLLPKIYCGLKFSFIMFVPLRFRSLIRIITECQFLYSSRQLIIE